MAREDFKEFGKRANFEFLVSSFESGRARDRHGRARKLAMMLCKLHMVSNLRFFQRIIQNVHMDSGCPCDFGKVAV
jgi:hypothetical protein